MYAIIQSIISIFLSIFTIFSSAAAIPVKNGRVDEAKLSARYQDGSWSGEFTTGNGHTAEVKGGLLYVDGLESVYPADSSVSDHLADPIYTDNRGAWFADYEANEIRHDSRGRNLFTLKLEDLRTVLDINEWRVKVEDGLICLYNYDGSLIAAIDPVRYGVSSIAYGIIG